MILIEILKAILFGIVEGITEWLPVSSTGHIILLKDICPLDITENFYDVFEMVIQLGAILAVLVLFFKKLNPFVKDDDRREEIWKMWLKVIVAVIPSAVIGLLIDDPLDNFLRGTPVLGTNLNVIVVSAMLILYGVLFIVLERKKDRKFKINKASEIDYRTAILIGAFQCLSIIPGTSRSGATILGAILLGVSRSAGAEFSFFMAIPTMLGASGKNLLEYGLDVVKSEAPAPNLTEVLVLIVGCVVAFAVSLLVIKGLMEYVRKHSFSSFGIYRIVLGVVVIAYFAIRALI